VYLLAASCGERPALGVIAQQISEAVAQCNGGVYAADVEVPAVPNGACYVVVVALADGSKKRAELQVA
jgi:hypothetical protein